MTERSGIFRVAMGPVRMSPALMGVVAAAAVGGCTVVMAPPHPPHPPRGAAAEIAAGLVNGEPSPGAQPNAFGIWIWRTTDGRWHVRSASEGRVRTFRGAIEGETAPINWYEVDQMEGGDNIGHRGESLVFLFKTGGHLDGFRFMPDDNGCVRFHITLDEVPVPGRIHLGASGASPPSEHFVACP